MQALKPQLMAAVLESFAAAEGERRTSSSSKAPAARPRSTCAPATSPTWALPRRRRAGDPGRRHRPRRGDRELVGTQAVLEPRGCGDDRRLPHQQVPRRRSPVRRRHGGDRAADRLAGARGRAVFPGARRLPAEDALDLVERRAHAQPGTVRVAVPLLPRIANFDDLDPLAAEPEVDVVMVTPGRAAAGRRGPRHPAGLEGDHRRPRHLRAQGWDIDIAAHVPARRPRARPLRRLPDAGADDRRSGRHRGRRRNRCRALGLLQVDTVIEGEKTLAEVSGTTLADAAPVKGYEMHMGASTGPDTRAAAGALPRRPADGAISADGRIAGTYVHGFFANDAQRRAWIERLGGTPSPHSHEAEIRGRSMRSPRISRRTSTSIACSE